MDNESCYAAIRLTQKGQPTQNVPLTYPRKKFDPRKNYSRKIIGKKDPRPTQSYPRPTTHDSRSTTHDPRSFSNPRNPRNPRNLAHSENINSCPISGSVAGSWDSKLRILAHASAVSAPSVDTGNENACRLL